MTDYNNNLSKKLVILLLSIVYIFLLIQKNKNNKYIKKLNIKPYKISNYNKSHIRYNFQNIFYSRKLFKINYSFLPYINIDKSIPYEQNAWNIYVSNGILNITKLDYYYNSIDINTFDLNHIHISMAFDNNYLDLSTISMASILNTSNNDTYIHFHILCLNFEYKDIQKIIQLKRINKNIDFTFYNAQQAEYDFGEMAKRDYRGIGNYAKILAPEIVNNTKKILVIDSGDTIAQKDVSEIFYYDLGDNYFGFTLDIITGNYKNKNDFFFSNKLYPNTGVCLINVALFKKDELYKKAFFITRSYNNLPTPQQDIIISIAIYKFKYMPLNFNCLPFYDKSIQKNLINNNNKTKLIELYLKLQNYTPYKYTYEEILDAVLDPVIYHFYKNKITKSSICNKYTYQFINYSKLTGFYKEIKSKYML